MYNHPLSFYPRCGYKKDIYNTLLKSYFRSRGRFDYDNVVVEFLMNANHNANSFVHEECDTHGFIGFVWTIVINNSKLMIPLINISITATKNHCTKFIFINHFGIENESDLSNAITDDYEDANYNEFRIVLFTIHFGII